MRAASPASRVPLPFASSALHDIGAAGGAGVAGGGGAGLGGIGSCACTVAAAIARVADSAAMSIVFCMCHLVRSAGDQNVRRTRVR